MQITLNTLQSAKWIIIGHIGVNSATRYDDADSILRIKTLIR